MTIPAYLQPVSDRSSIHRVVRYSLALVWLTNGLWCKVLGAVPRHEAIAARILGVDDAGLWIKLIGGSEILMAAWVFSRIQTRLNAWTQVVIVALMNVLEYMIAPDLLLFGRANALIAAGFAALALWHGAGDGDREC